MTTATIVEFSGRARVQPTTRLAPATETAFTAAAKRITDELHKTGPTLPWRKSFDLQRLRDGEVTIWAGWPGHGKSALVNYCALHLLRQGVEVMILSLEMTADQVVAQLYRQMAATEKPSPAWMTAAARWLRDANLRLVGAGELVSPGEVLDAVETYLMGDICRHVVIDNISMLDLPEDKDAQAAARALSLSLKHLAERYRGHVHLVAHLRKGRSDADRPTMHDIAGSRHYIGIAYNIHTVWRNRPKESAASLSPEAVAALTPKEAERRNRLLEQPDTWLIVEKNRVGGWTGQIGLWFDSASQQFLAGPDHTPRAVEEVRA